MESARDVYWHTLRWFRREEFSAPEKMNTELLAGLDFAREHAGVPFKITSSYRDGDPGAHGRGLAVDIQARSAWVRFRILRGLFAAGFCRIGVYERHVHADIASHRTQDVLWYGRYHPDTQEGSDAKTEDEPEAE